LRKSRHHNGNPRRVLGRRRALSARGRLVRIPGNANAAMMEPMRNRAKLAPGLAPVPPAAQALALQLVNDCDLLRLKVIARLHGRSLPPDVSWADLLQEAFARVLDGSRAIPAGVPTTAFLAGVMRSIKAEHWRRRRRAARQQPVLATEYQVVVAETAEACDPLPDPERWMIAAQQLEAIGTLFAQDCVALQIIAGLGDGLPAEEIRRTLGLTRTDYDSARRRMRRALIRAGLTLGVQQ
jgi:DNA-directed RNA polymerase specialized sigma24 family protein